MAINKSGDTLLKSVAGSEPLRLALHLPGHRRDGSMIEGFEEMADEIAGLIHRRFEGVTTYATTGHFTCADGLRRESVRVVEFRCSRARLEQARQYLHSLLCGLRHCLGQESMALSIDGSLMLLPLEALPTLVPTMESASLAA